MELTAGTSVFEPPRRLRARDPWPGRRYVWRERVWKVLARGTPFDRGPHRNVLIEDVDTGERVVRPFRGLWRCV